MPALQAGSNSTCTTSLFDTGCRYSSNSRGQLPELPCHSCGWWLGVQGHHSAEDQRTGSACVVCQLWYNQRKCPCVIKGRQISLGSKKAWFSLTLFSHYKQRRVFCINSDLLFLKPKNFSARNCLHIFMPED